MSWTVRAIVGPALATGFRLAGVATDDADAPGDVAALISARAAEPRLGILLIEQRLLDAMPETVRHALERRPVPIIVPVPSASWGPPADAESLILSLLRRAIGYRVKLR